MDHQSVKRILELVSRRIAPVAGVLSTSSCSAPSGLILVVGPHRSGTSAITRTLYLMGAIAPGGLMSPQPDNPLGFWEVQSIVDCHDRFLQAAGSSWDDPQPLDPAVYSSRAARSCRRALLGLLRCASSGGGVLVVKDPRLCRLLPIWREVIDALGCDVRLVMPVRNPLEVSFSLMRRNGMSQTQALRLWLVDTLWAEYESRKWPRFYVRYRDFLADPVTAAEDLAVRLELLPPGAARNSESAIRGFWSEALRHHRYDDEEVLADAIVPASVRDTYRWLLKQSCEDDASSKPLDRLRAAILDGGTEIFPADVGGGGMARYLPDLRE